MEEQIIDIESSAVEEEETVITPEINLNEHKIKSPQEIKQDLQQLKSLNKQLKKIKKYIKSPIYQIRQMDARSNFTESNE